MNSEGEKTMTHMRVPKKKKNPKFINSYLRNQVMNLTTTQKKNESVIITKLFLI